MKYIHTFLSLFFFSGSLHASNLFAYRNEERLIVCLVLFLCIVFLPVIIRYFIQRIIPKKIGFVSVVPNHRDRFVSYDPEKDATLERIVKKLSGEKIKVYSNLSKMKLSQKNGALFIEDQNAKISYLVNRRRFRNQTLKDGDIIDIGELTMMLVDPNTQEKQLVEEKAKKKLRISRAGGQLLKDTSTLTPLDQRRKTFFLTKNLTFVGRSDQNDLIVKVMDVDLRHAKLQRIANRYKLTDLNSKSGTFINGKRINEAYLSEKDLVSFESVQYRFSQKGKN